MIHKCGHRKQFSILHRDMNECIVCTESFTKAVRRPVSCSHCSKAACCQCYQKYLLSSCKDPQCMFCAAEWTTDFLHDNFTGAFRHGPFKRHRERVLLDREKSLIPQTMHAVERIRRKEAVDIEVKQIDGEIQRVSNELFLLQHRKHRLIRPLPRQDEPTRPEAPLCSCPVEGCRGFVMGSGSCGACGTVVCIACHEVRGEDHVCQKEAIESVRAIQRQCKPCPNCMAPIYRTEGCSQMWCILCNTAFDWHTGERVRGRVHNPHYFEWLAHGGLTVRAPQDVVCGGLPNAILMSNRVRHVLGGDGLMEFLRILAHIEDVTLPRLRRAAMPNPNENETMRALYILGRVSEDELAARIYANEKKRQKGRVQLDMIEMLYMAGQASLANFFQAEFVDASTVAAAVNELLTLFEYYNDCAQKQATIFKNTFLHYDHRSFKYWWMAPVRGEFRHVHRIEEGSTR